MWLLVTTYAYSDRPPLPAYLISVLLLKLVTIDLGFYVGYVLARDRVSKTAPIWCPAIGAFVFVLFNPPFLGKLLQGVFTASPWLIAGGWLTGLVVTWAVTYGRRDVVSGIIFGFVLGPLAFHSADVFVRFGLR